MARDNYRKVKLIKLLELLRQNTDMQHPMTNSQVCAAMDEMGIPWYDATIGGVFMEDHPRVKKKRRDVKVHYIRREYNSNIVPDAKTNTQANKKTTKAL